MSPPRHLTHACVAGINYWFTEYYVYEVPGSRQAVCTHGRHHPFFNGHSQSRLRLWIALTLLNTITANICMTLTLPHASVVHTAVYFVFLYPNRTPQQSETSSLRHRQSMEMYGQASLLGCSDLIIGSFLHRELGAPLDSRHTAIRHEP